MNIVTRKHVMQAAASYPDAARELMAWRRIVQPARWQSFIEVRRTFADADSVDGFVVFNIRGNRYRLITVIHYSKDIGQRITEGQIYVRSFLTHKEYDNKSNWNRGV